MPRSLPLLMVATGAQADSSSSDRLGNFTRTRAALLGVVVVGHDADDEAGGDQSRFSGGRISSVSVRLERPAIWKCGRVAGVRRGRGGCSS